MPSTGRGGAGSPGGGGSSTSSQLPAGQPVALAAHPAVDHDVARVGHVGGGGAGQPEQPRQRLVDALPLEPVGHGQRPVQAGGDSVTPSHCDVPAPAAASGGVGRGRLVRAARVPSNSMPRSASSAPRMPPQTIAESATLNTGQYLPVGAEHREEVDDAAAQEARGRGRSGRSGCRRRRPAPGRAATAQPVENSRRDVRTITTATSTAIRLNTTVEPSAKENAAPTLRNWVR